MHIYPREAQAFVILSGIGNSPIRKRKEPPLDASNNHLVEKIDDYLTHSGPYFSPWDQEERVRQEIVRTGVNVVPLLIDQACLKFASFGKPDALDHFLAGPMTMRVINLIATRTWAILANLVDTAPQAGKAVAEQLVAIMGDREHLGKRAVAAWCCGIRGVDNAVTLRPLAKHFDYDGKIVQIACAITIVAEKTVPQTTREHARKVINHFVETSAFLSEKYVGDLDGERLIVYQVLLVETLPIFFALTLHEEVQPS